MKVKIITRKRNVALIEWVETLGEELVYRRSVVPATELEVVNGNGATHSDPDMGIPYGLAWEAMLVEFGMPDTTAGRIANELRRMGIWILADLQANPQTARAAFQRAYGMDVQRLQVAARQHHSGGQA